MATNYNAICICGHQFAIAKGRDMHYIQAVCDSCGSLSAIPRKIPAGFGQPLTMDEIASMLTKEGGSTWRTGSGSFNAEESAMLDSLTCDCQCGGKYVREYLPGASYRCPKCKSDTFEKLSLSGLVSD